MAVALEVIYEVEDRDGDRSTTSVKVPNGFSISQFTEFGAAMATLIDAMLEGRVSGADLALSVDLSGLTFNTLDLASDVEDIGAFQFRTSENRPVRVNIPGINEINVLDYSDDLDQAAPSVSAFIAMMESGLAVTLGTISPCDVAEDDIIAVEYARERFRASGKRA